MLRPKNVSFNYLLQSTFLKYFFLVFFLVLNFLQGESSLKHLRSKKRDWDLAAARPRPFAIGQVAEVVAASFSITIKGIPAPHSLNHLVSQTMQPGACFWPGPDKRPGKKPASSTGDADADARR